MLTCSATLAHYTKRLSSAATGDIDISDVRVTTLPLSVAFTGS